MGSEVDQCVECRADSFLWMYDDFSRSGRCLPKTSATITFYLIVSNLFSVVENGTPNQLRDGSLKNPFIDLRDAVSRAIELGAPHSNAKVTVLLTKGVHFITQEPLL